MARGWVGVYGGVAYLFFVVSNMQVVLLIASPRCSVKVLQAPIPIVCRFVRCRDLRRGFC